MLRIDQKVFKNLFSTLKIALYIIDVYEKALKCLTKTDKQQQAFKDLFS